MEFEKVVLKRRMVRNFKPDPLPEEFVKRVMEFAQHAPSAGFSQGVAYVVVREEKLRKELGRVQGEEEYVQGKFHNFISGAPMVVVVCVSESIYHSRYREPDKLKDDGSEIDWPTPYWFFDAGAASMIILLSAVDNGLAAAFAGVPNPEGVKQLLRIPDEFHPVGTISIGKPAPDVKSPSLKRGHRPFKDVVHYEYW
jgi:nitroreductase